MAFGVEGRRKVYRGRLEIIRDILQVVRDTCSRKTHIMYRANLSYKLLKNYLEYVLGAGLIEYDGNAFYTITEKGETFLEVYQDYESVRMEINKRINHLRNGRKTLEEMLVSQRSRPV